ncbi:hypothetical protein TIFTF001_024105 [Ficus carica]|uniref:Uncharacterized protein n=1 Tax=Ficus carica TaxID=3494 RepID=A0AA88AHF7_FICCA|nr:hypothetical protein TIFTF001_024105 [Ficus carica]
MLKSARKLMSKRRGRALARQKMIIPEFGGSSSIYRRFSWVRVLGATRPGRLPRVPSGVPWASPVKGQQCPSEWLAAGGDLTDDRSRWVVSAAGLSGTRSPEYSASTGKASRSARWKGLREHAKPRRRHASPTSQRRCTDALHRVSAGRRGSVINIG